MNAHGEQVMGRACARRRAAAIVLFGALCACRSMGDVVKAKEDGDGTVQVYPVSCREAYDVAAAVLRTDEDVDALEEHRAHGYMLAGKGYNFISFGTLIGVWVEPAKRGCSVTAITKRKWATDLVTRLRESTFHREFAERLQSRPAAAVVPAAAEAPAAAPPPGEVVESKPQASSTPPAKKEPAKKPRKASPKRCKADADCTGGALCKEGVCKTQKAPATQK